MASSPQMKAPEIQKLTGSPSATAVSDVAKGDKASTLNEMDKAYQDMNGEVRQGMRPEMGKPKVEDGVEDIQEAYALLFEGLSMIAKFNSQEEDSEETEDNEEYDGSTSGHPDGCSCGSC